VNTSDWTCDKIRVLRLRLGCNQAEFARRLGCNLDMIREWENEISFPTVEVCSQMAGLWEQVENASEQLPKRALAEALIRTRQLAQMSSMDSDLGVTADGFSFDRKN
jgi:transcriptional regulator with XRE-family HTH domain